MKLGQTYENKKVLFRLRWYVVKKTKNNKPQHKTTKLIPIITTIIYFRDDLKLYVLYLEAGTKGNKHKFLIYP